jgi:hypothetical protein
MNIKLYHSIAAAFGSTALKTRESSGNLAASFGFPDDIWNIWHCVWSHMWIIYEQYWINSECLTNINFNWLANRESSVSTVSCLWCKRPGVNSLETKNKQTPWPQSVSELYRPSDRRLSAEFVTTFADIRCCVVSATDPYGSILGFLERIRYFFFQVAPHLYSRVWVDPVPDPLHLRKFIEPGIEPGPSDLYLWQLDHRRGPIPIINFNIHHPVQTGSRVLPASCSVCNGGCFPRLLPTEHLVRMLGMSLSLCPYDSMASCLDPEANLRWISP